MESKFIKGKDRSSAPERQEKEEGPLRSHGVLWRLSPWLSGLIILFLSIVSWDMIRDEQNARHNAYFHALIGEVEDALQERYRLYEMSLRGGLGLYNASHKVTLDEWTRYVGSLKIKESLPGINGVGMIRLVDEKNLDAYIRSVRKEIPGFINHPETEHKDKFIITYIVPEEINKEAIGLDIAFESNRRTAAIRAMKTEQPALTKKIELVQDERKGAGFLLLIPLHTKEPDKEFLGWIYAPFIGEKFLHDLMDIVDNKVHFEVYDGTETTDETLIYAIGNSSAYTRELIRENARLTEKTHIELAGREWTFLWHTTPAFETWISYGSAEITLLGGVLLAILLTWTLYKLIHQKETVEYRVRERTRDVTRLKNRLQMIMDNIPDLVFVKDEKLRIIEANPAFLSVFPPEERQNIVGKTSVENFTEEESNVFISQDRIALESGYSETVENISDYQGKQRILNTKKVGFTDIDGQRYILGVSRDVTQVRQTQKQLQDSERRFNQAVTGARIGIWDWDILNDDVFYNDIWYTMLGYEPQELPMTFETWRMLIHPEDLENAENRLQEHIEGKTDFYESLARMRDKGGDWTWIRTTGRAVEFDDNGRATRIIGIHADLTVIKRSEQEAERAKEEARRASRMKSEFVANMSHEIRTPMNGILGMAELLMKSDLKPREFAYAQTLITSAESLLSLIDDILDFSKIEAGKLTLEPRPCRLRPLLEEVVDLHAIKAREKSIELVLFETAGIPEIVNIDPGRFRQVINNLLSNAVKFTEQGHVLVKIEHIEKKKSEENLKISIEDTGVGIPDSAQKTIFGQFEQGDASTTRRFGGSGLGLSISKQLTEKMGGTISLVSGENTGSTFTIKIPVRTMENAQNLPQIKGEALIVGNHPVIANVIAAYLGEIGLKAKILERFSETKTMDIGNFDLLVTSAEYLSAEENNLAGKNIGPEIIHKLPSIILIANNEDESLTSRNNNWDSLLSRPIRKQDFLITVLSILSDHAPEGTNMPSLTDERPGKSPQIRYTAEGAHILLVDDSPVNQVVAEEFIKDMGCIVTLADNGRDAISVLENAPNQFDLIILDCRMPVMDGFDTTRTIRKMEKKGDLPSRLPIIALTAGALTEERDRCFESGMDDFLAKPVRSETLKKKIYEWLDKTGKARKDEINTESAENISGNGNEDTEDPDDVPLSLNFEAGILSTYQAEMGNRAQRIISLYLNETEKNLTNIANMIAEKNPNIYNISRLSHSIKSSSAQFGAMNLSILAERMEEITENIENTDAALCRRLTKLHAQMLAVFKETAPLIREAADLTDTGP